MMTHCPVVKTMRPNPNPNPNPSPNPNPNPDPNPNPNPTHNHNPNPNPNQVKTMRALRKEYRIGIEFTNWPTRPKPKPLKGPILADARWRPIDLIEGTCVGTCGYATPRPFKKTVRGLYHK